MDTPTKNQFEDSPSDLVSMSAATASRCYKPGEVLSECQPLVYVLHIKYKSLLCDRCFRKAKPPDTLKMCGRCHRVWYCGRQCQLADWFIHKRECQVFTSHHDHYFGYDNAFLPLLMRTTLLFQSNPELAKEKRWLFTGQKMSFDDLPVNQRFMDPASGHDIEGQCRALKLFFDIDYGPAEIKWCCQLKTNSYTVMAQTGERKDLPGLQLPVASAVALELATMKHSCVPNTFQVFDGNHFMLVAATNLMNQCFSFCFATPCASVADRQQRLESVYNKKCECKRCLAGDETHSDGRPVNYLYINMLRDVSLGIQSHLWDLRDELGNDSQALELFNKIYPNHHPEKTQLLVKFVRVEIVLIGRYSVSLVRAAIEELKVTHPNEQVEAFDVWKDPVNVMAEYVAYFKGIK